MTDITVAVAAVRSFKQEVINLGDIAIYVANRQNGLKEALIAEIFGASGFVLPTGFDSRRHTTEVTRTERIVQGTLNGVDVDCNPDTRSCINAISLEFAQKQRWPIRRLPNLPKVTLPANRSVRPIGVVTLSWRFSGESTLYDVEFIVLPKCVYPVILGRDFLISSKTTNPQLFYRRFKKKREYPERRNCICFLGSSFDKTRCAFNGHTAWALADTGSDVMVVSRKLCNGSSTRYQNRR
jgi:hypothetical protein